jgi:hypothetical protein
MAFHGPWGMVSAVAAGHLLLLAGTACADGVVPGRLHLRTGTIELGPGNLLAAPAVGPHPHVLLFDGPMTPDRRAALAGAGVALGDYLPTNAFIADVSKSTPAQLRALPFVTWAGEFRREWKLDPALAAGAHGRPFTTVERRAMADQGLVAANVWLFQGEPADPAAAAIHQIPNARVNFSETIAGSVCLTVIMPAQDANRLADIASVQFAEHCNEFTPRAGNLETSWIVQSNIPDFRPLYDAGLTGAGQVAGVIDGGIAITHCSFSDPINPIGPNHRKVLLYTAPQFNDTHGTHVAGTFAGDAGLPNDTRGIAFGARIVFSQWPNPTAESQYQKHQTHYQAGAAVHNNSWGDDSTNQYDAACRGIDAFQHENDDNLIIFAVTDSSQPVRNPENAKNPLAVAASGTAGFQEQMCIGGWSPTLDGRRKPEVTAPGCAISSSLGATCQTGAFTGTSMAAPAVSGAALLARQYFTDGYYPTGTPNPGNAFTPSGALVKAVVVNSARDMVNSAGYPGIREGWGRVTIADPLGMGAQRRAMIFEDVRNGSAAALSTGGHLAVPFYINACGGELRVTLTYFDAPAAAGAQLTPVNNLDLIVTDPNGIAYKGNVFANGVSAPGGQADAINNLEQVHVFTPPAGPWSVRVVGAAVNAGTQGFALVITGPVDQLECSTSDVDCDGDTGTDADIEAFFAALAGGGASADFNRDGDTGTDADIESFFRVLAGGPC